MANYRARIKTFEDVLEGEVTDLKTLRKLCINGCPRESSIRAISWKILLNYLPLEKNQRSDTLARQRALYSQFIKEMIIIPGKDAQFGEKSEDVIEDHPLNPNPESKWTTYFKDNEMLLQIDKDCRRLCPDLFFFQRATEHPCEEMVNPEFGVETLRKRVEHTVLKSETVSKNWAGMTNMSSKRKKKPDEYATLPDGQEAHWEVLERILFIYAKLNPGLGYVQGMNEILGPLYYSFATDPDINSLANAEADAFFCFTNLMAEIRDNFIKTLDDSACGIGAMMKRLFEILEKEDTPLWQTLKEQEMKPQYFAFRWLTLMLSQEFSLPDVIRIWDYLFADKNRFNDLIYVCCSMLILIRNELLNGDFPSNMKLLQNQYAESFDVWYTTFYYLTGMAGRHPSCLCPLPVVLIHNYHTTNVEVTSILEKALELSTSVR